MSVFSTMVIVFIGGILLYWISVFLLRQINKIYLIKTIEINKFNAENGFCEYAIGRCIVEDNPFRNKRYLIIDCKHHNNYYYYKYVYVEINRRGEMIPPVSIDTGTSYFSNDIKETEKTEQRYFKKLK